MKKFFKVMLFIFLAIFVILLGFVIANKISEISINKYIDSFDAVEKENKLIPQYDEYGNPYFTTDGDFKVLHLTDIHLTGGVIGRGKDKKAINAVAAMITAEKPDLVVITGDISFAVPWHGTINNKYAHSYFIRLMENLGVYWTVSFGNHDSEAYNYYNRPSVANMYDDDDLKYCLFDKGDGEVSGEGNHVINLKNSNGLITKSFIILDSGSYTEDDPLGIKWDYECMDESQVKWYKETVEKYSAYNEGIYNSLPEESRPAEKDKFTTVQSLLFFHIPLKETRNAYNEYVNNGSQNTENVEYIRGNAGEEDKVVYCSEYEDNLFETVLELGSTKAMFYGHDHLNNFVLEYKGVTLSYGYSVDYSAYAGISKKGYQRGCAVITCSPDTSFNITHENYYQDKYPSLYEKEEVDMSK